MTRHLLIIDGHPDPAPGRFVHALAAAYAEGAKAAGHAVQRLTLAEMDIPILSTREDFEGEFVPPQIAGAQEAIRACDHIALFYPLWLGDMPALLKAFLEQVMRPGFAFEASRTGLPRKLLKGRSAHVVVTMGMPAFFYRFYYGAHSVRSLERNILKLTGIAPVTHSLIGNVEASAEEREEWLERMRALGALAD